MKYFLSFILVVTLMACQDQTVRLTGYEVHGIDVSHYQGVIDWEMVANQDIKFVFLKATEGESFVDSFFLQNWEAANHARIIRGAYHFYRPKVSATKQVNHFLNAADFHYGDLPPVLDVEVLDGVDKIQLLSGMLTWLYLVEVKTGMKPIIYTSFKFYHKYLDGHFDEYPIWIARYTKRKPKMLSDKTWLFWQYGNQGQLKGIDGEVDFNVFHGSYPELLELCKKPQPVRNVSQKLSD